MALLLVAGGGGCGHAPARPPNPILEDAQANLQAVESRLAKKPALTNADYLELGKARRQVWSIYLARSRYPAGTAKTRRKAAANGRAAERLEPKMIEALRLAADAPDPHLAARAKIRLATVYGMKRDWDQQVAVVRQILRDHGGPNGPRAFGVGGTPHYYCYYTMGEAFKAKGSRGAAVDCYARALLAIDMGEKAGVDFGYRQALVLGKLVDYDPRIVLPSYQRLLPAHIDELHGTASFVNRTGPPPALARMFEEYRKNAHARISLTVHHVDHNGALIGYEVIYPGYPKIIDEWQKQRQEPRPYMPDDFMSHIRPTFRLSFATLPARLSFDTPANIRDYATTALGSTPVTATLVFDHDGRSAGKIILKWSDKGPRPLDLYLTAKLGCPYRAWARAVPPGQVYMEPLQVTVPRNE